MLLIFYKIFLLSIISRGLSCITASFWLCGRWWVFPGLLHYLLEVSYSLTSTVICWRCRISLASSIICWRCRIPLASTVICWRCRIPLASSVICWRCRISLAPPLFCSFCFFSSCFFCSSSFFLFFLLLKFLLFLFFFLFFSSSCFFNSSCFSLLQFFAVDLVLVFCCIRYARIWRRITFSPFIRSSLPS